MKMSIRLSRPVLFLSLFFFFCSIFFLFLTSFIQKCKQRNKQKDKRRRESPRWRLYVHRRLTLLSHVIQSISSAITADYRFIPAGSYLKIRQLKCLLSQTLTAPSLIPNSGRIRTGIGQSKWFMYKTTGTQMNWMQNKLEKKPHSDPIFHVLGWKLSPVVL